MNILIYVQLDLYKINKIITIYKYIIILMLEYNTAYDFVIGLMVAKSYNILCCFYTYCYYFMNVLSPHTTYYKQKHIIEIYYYYK